MTNMGVLGVLEMLGVLNFTLAFCIHIDSMGVLKYWGVLKFGYIVFIYREYWSIGSIEFLCLFFLFF